MINKDANPTAIERTMKGRRDMITIDKSKVFIVFGTEGIRCKKVKKLLEDNKCLFTFKKITSWNEIWEDVRILELLPELDPKSFHELPIVIYDGDLLFYVDLKRIFR